MTKRYLQCIAVLCFIFLSCTGSGGKAAGNSDSVPDTQTGPGNTVADTRQWESAEFLDDSVFADGSVPTSWETAGISNPLAVKQFIKKLQTWIRAGTTDSIAAHIEFPLKNPPVKTIGEFRRNYTTYFSDAVKNAILKQNLSQLFRNQHGVMLGQGQLWITEKNNTILIIAINH